MNGLKSKADGSYAFWSAPLALLSTLLCFWPAASWSWSNHALISHTALRKTSLATIKVVTEPLEEFIAATETELTMLLNEIQKEQQTTVNAWPALPSELIFKSGLPIKDKKKAFFKAIRVRSIFPAALYLQPIAGVNYETANSMELAEVVARKTENLAISKTPLIALTKGQKVSALDVISTSSDEPDFGMDMNLWKGLSDDGDQYLFGLAPYGRTGLEYTTQAPFHMGFYHEGWLLYKLSANYKVGYGPARVLLYKKLSRFAFAHHHDYWGYRFLGWALHYIQDATQPYHSSLVPGTSTASIIATATLNAIHIKRPQELKTYEVINLHAAIEDFQFRSMVQELESENQTNLFTKALEGNSSNQAPTQSPAPCSPSRYLKDVVAARAYDQGRALYKGLVDFVPSEIVYASQPPPPEMDFLKLEEQAPAERREAFETTVLKLYNDVGESTRHFVFNCN